MKPKIYIFSIFNWESSLLHREHMLAKSFVELGYSVCFVERSYTKLFSSQPSFKDEVEIRTIFALPYLKGIFGWVFRLNDWVITTQLTKFANPKEGAWYILSSPLWAKSVQGIKSENQKLVYDISDDHLAFTTNKLWRKNLEKYEHFLLSQADFITLTSSNLIKKVPKEKPYQIAENGVDLKSFSLSKPILKEKFNRKIVGFIGGVYQRVNLDLVVECAKAYPKADFVVVGPTSQSAKIKKLKEISNFHYFDSIPWNKIGDYFASLDVGLIPFVSESEYTWLKTVDSVKVYQYAYFGYPIVSTKFGQIQTLEPMVKVAESNQDFIRQVGEALTKPEAKEIRARRLKLAQDHDWIEITKWLASAVNSAKSPNS